MISGQLDDLRTDLIVFTTCVEGLESKASQSLGDHTSKEVGESSEMGRELLNKTNSILNKQKIQTLS
jgi:hypothetical protein